MDTKEAKAIYSVELTRLAEKVAARLGIERNENGELPAVPQQLITAEAVKEAFERG